MYKLNFEIAPHDGMVEGGGLVGELESSYVIFDGKVAGEDGWVQEFTVHYNLFNRADGCKAVDREEWKSYTLIEALLSAEKHYETLVQARQRDT
jgi:hypothetical protein